VLFKRVKSILQVKVTRIHRMGASQYLASESQGMRWRGAREAERESWEGRKWERAKGLRESGLELRTLKSSCSHQILIVVVETIVLLEHSSRSRCLRVALCVPAAYGPCGIWALRHMGPNRLRHAVLLCATSLQRLAERKRRTKSISDYRVHPINRFSSDSVKSAHKSNLFWTACVGLE